MPRQARIDAPGAVHHIICRGIERRKIFLDDLDRDRFVARFGEVLQKTETRCFAWSLLPNHFHLLLQTGRLPIATVMRRLLTGYAVYFNRRHNRAGHLFQNRYKSILCQVEPYLLELVRYIHLNPLRAKIVHSLSELSTFQYCGHRLLVSENLESWQSAEEVLQRFDESKKIAQTLYAEFVSEGVAIGARADLIGGGLVRSAGGWQEVALAHRSGVFLKSDERILGDSDFVDAVLSAAEERMERGKVNQFERMGLEQVAQRVAELLKISVELVWHSGKMPLVVQARSLVCFWGTQKLGMTDGALAEKLGISPSGVSRAAVRGEQLASEQGWQLM